MININIVASETNARNLLTIVQCFSSRLYGLRNYRKHIKEALSSYDTSAHDTPEPDA